LDRERRTVDVMVGIYCRGHHDSGVGMCPECAELREYAFARLDRCRFGEGKPTCANCRVHCYRPGQRERVRAVMRYSGPRMLLRHPVLAIAHVVDGKRNPADG
jgi:predicted amidophosphoribosyltransferase